MNLDAAGAKRKRPPLPSGAACEGKSALPRRSDLSRFARPAGVEIGERCMHPLVAVIAPGMMGAAVGKRLVDHGLKVLTSLEGRSFETSARAKAAGMLAASDEEIVAADFILSILPPGDAVALAQRFQPALTASNSKPVYVDCNAVSPRTAAPRFAALKDYGLDVRVLGGPMSAASALKMSYAGITKGTQALGAAMMLAATRGGTADALFAELQGSQPQMLAWLKR